MMQEREIMKSDHAWLFSGCQNIKMRTENEVAFSNGAEDRAIEEMSGHIEYFIRNSGRPYTIRRDAGENSRYLLFDKPIVKKDITIVMINRKKILNEITRIFFDARCSAFAEKPNINQDLFRVFEHQLQNITR